MTTLDDNIRYLPRLSMSGAMRLFGMTARAIRFYEKQGLIEARRDRRNARYFDASARVRLERIGQLRAGGVALQDIAQVLDEADRGGAFRDLALKTLDTRRAQVRQELEAVEAAIAAIDGAAPAPAERPAAGRVAAV
ncbi:MAG TPA: MerR family transcriptional regulator [Caulobacteraceae bacterium]|nr:MerR family transcriptional regulator [Caulobacteraceae bacterium]